MSDVPMMPVPQECRFCKWWSPDWIESPIGGTCTALPPGFTSGHNEPYQGLWRQTRERARFSYRNRPVTSGGDGCVLWQYKGEDA